MKCPECSREMEKINVTVERITFACPVCDIVDYENTDPGSWVSIKPVSRTARR